MARYAQLSGNTSGGIQELIPQVIIPEIQATAARTEAFMPNVRRLDLTGPGDTFSMPQAGAMSFSAHTAGAEPDEDAFNTAERTLTPALRILDVVVPIDAAQSSQIGVQEAVIEQVGVELAGDRDAQFASLHIESSGVTGGDVGTDGTALGMGTIRSILSQLYGQEAPRRYAWVVHPTQVAELLADSTFIDASVKGAPVLTQGMGENGFVTSILDIDIYATPQIVESTGLHSMCFSKNAAFGYGFKRIQHPVTGESQEVLVDIDWNSARRVIEINTSYWAAFGGLKGTSTTSNNWLVDAIS